MLSWDKAYLLFPSPDPAHSYAANGGTAAFSTTESLRLLLGLSTGRHRKEAHVPKNWRFILFTEAHSPWIGCNDEMDDRIAGQICNTGYVVVETHMFYVIKHCFIYCTNSTQDLSFYKA